MTNTTISEAKNFDFNGYTDYRFYARRLPSQEIEIPTFTKGESQCQTLQIAEKELKGQAA